MSIKKPTNLKKLHNTYRMDRAPKNEALPDPAKDLEAPDYLGDSAKRYWYNMVPKLQKMGLLTELDLGAFAVCCVNYGIIEDCAKWLKDYIGIDRKGNETGDDGLTGYLGGGSAQTNQVFAAMCKATQNYKTYLATFGLSPADRTKIEIPKAPDKDEFAEYLNKTK